MISLNCCRTVGIHIIGVPSDYLSDLLFHRSFYRIGWPDCLSYWKFPMSSSEEATCSIAYDEIQRCANHNGPKPFYPKSALSQVLTEQRIRQILQCECGRCLNHRKLLGKLGKPIDYFRAIIGTKNVLSQATNAISLFGLLIHIKYPMFIIGFLESGQTDEHLENGAVIQSDESRDQFCEQICRTFWKKYYNDDKEGCLAVAHTFRENMYHFAVPRMHGPEYRTYHEETILPFVNERPVGKINENGEVENEGAYGTVYSFEIPDEYRDFTVSRYFAKTLTGFWFNAIHTARTSSKEIRPKRVTCY